MAVQSFGCLQIDPARNPAVLDTATWRPAAAAAALRAVDAAAWEAILPAARSGGALPTVPWASLGVPGPACPDGSVGLSARLRDGQEVLLVLGQAGNSPEPAGTLIFRTVLPGGTCCSAHAADLDTLPGFIAAYAPGRGPVALGPVPRLGIGTRMSASAWPGIWQAMRTRPFAANAIQNSVRELNLLDDLISGRPPRVNYLFGFGPLDEGHTGSTFEGLWLAGVLSALRTPGPRRYGADADHIMVKRGADGLDRARQVAAAARHYTFFTLDVSDVLDYRAITVESPAEADARFGAAVPEAPRRREIALWHAAPDPDLPGLSPLAVARCAAKFAKALDAAEALHRTIARCRAGAPFDLELSIDEVPADVPMDLALTRAVEIVFLLRECRRRELPVTHIAPNLGVEKGTDYRLPDGLAGLGRRTRDLHGLLARADVLLDCHSGDDLSRGTCRVIGQAAGGRLHFKISPSLQVLFAEVLRDAAPEVFRRWWDDTVAYAERASAAGSPVAARLLAEAAGQPPGPEHGVFHQFCFATVGRRSATGGFLCREMFYDLPSAVLLEYQERLSARLLQVVDDLFGGC